jgi:hypothetical protein
LTICKNRLNIVGSKIAHELQGNVTITNKLDKSPILQLLIMLFVHHESLFTNLLNDSLPHRYLYILQHHDLQNPANSLSISGLTCTSKSIFMNEGRAMVQGPPQVGVRL